jgi:hypothetical protein
MRQCGLLWLAASALLFLLGASALDGAGARQLAAIGVAGAIAVLAVLAAFF